MDRRTLLAIAICFLIFAGWQKYYIEPRLPKTKIATQSASTQKALDQKVGPGAVSPRQQEDKKNGIKIAKQEPKKIERLTGTGTAVLSNGGKFFSNWSLSDYRVSQAKDASPVDLNTVTQMQEGNVELAFDLPEYAYLNQVFGELVEREGAIFWNYEDDKIRLEREFFTDAGSNFFTAKIKAEFKSDPPKNAFLSLNSKVADHDAEEQDKQLVYYTNESIERIHLSSVKPVMDLPGEMSWIGVQNRYFLMALLPETKTQRALAQSTGEKQGKISLVFPVTTRSIEIPFKIYFGPKKVSVLKTVDPSLEKTIDFGFLTFFAFPILKFMRWLQTIFLNWGLVIVVLTAVFKIATFPLTYKSMVGMKKMAALQPQIKELREKYKDDKQKLNQEMMSFMKTSGYNPVSGCLPMIIQMPIFFALYRVLYSAIELYHAPFYGWIHDLSQKDPYYITPIALSAIMFLQQKITPTTIADPMQAKMMKWIPVFFGLFMVNLPAGLTVYMLVNAILSIFQQMVINKKMNLQPSTTITANAT